MTEALRFHFRNGLFNLREQWSDLFSGISGFLMFPFYIWLMSVIWAKFNSFQRNFTLNEVICYVSLTELLFMTFFRIRITERASADFSLSLARPRSWLAFSFSAMFGSTLGLRLVYVLILMTAIPLLGPSVSLMGAACGRLLLLLPLLGLIQALFTLLFSSAQIFWDQTSFFALPISKVFLVLGGVFGPLADFAEPWRHWLLRFPPSDLFFQPAYFCVKGHFYGLSGAEWLLRIVLDLVFLGLLNLWFYRIARKYHQSYGG